MSTANQIAPLEQRLHRLSVRDRDNAGVCRKIRRQIRNLQKTLPAQEQGQEQASE